MSSKTDKFHRTIEYFPEKCVQCGWCISICKFSALQMDEHDYFHFHVENCNGCKLCLDACPRQALN
ncbi:MAG: ATP-binding protein [Promethearchaeota archaeon]